MKKFENRLSEKVKKLYTQHEECIKEMKYSVQHELTTLLNSTTLLKEFTIELNLDGYISDIQMKFEENNLTEEEFKNYESHVKRGIFSLLAPLSGDVLTMATQDMGLIVCNSDGVKTHYGMDKPELGLYEEFYGKKESD